MSSNCLSSTTLCQIVMIWHCRPNLVKWHDAFSRHIREVFSSTPWLSMPDRMVPRTTERRTRTLQPSRIAAGYACSMCSRPCAMPLHLIASCASLTPLAAEERAQCSGSSARLRRSKSPRVRPRRSNGGRSGATTWSAQQPRRPSKAALDLASGHHGLLELDWWARRAIPGARRGASPSALSRGPGCS